MNRSWDETIDDPSEADLVRALDELPGKFDDPEAWLSDDDTDATLMVNEAGVVSWENPACDAGPRHLCSLSKGRVIELWRLLQQGSYDSIEAQPWLPGLRPKRTPEELAAHQREVAAALLEHQRAFYEQLGNERNDVPCQRVHCGRGAVRFSVFCRPHHFENVHKVPCPFTD